MYAEKSHRLDSGWLLLGFRVFFAKVNQNLLLGHVYFHLLTAVPTNFRNSWTGKRSANEEIGHFDPLKSTWRMYSETSQLPHEQIVQRKYDRICKYYNGQMKKYLFGSALRHFVLASNLELQMFFWVYGFWAFLLQASYKCFWSVLCVDVCCPFFRDRILIRFCVESVFCLHFFASNMDSGRVSGVRFFWPEVRYVGALFLASCQIPPLPGYGFFFGYMNSRWLFWGSIFSSKNERIVFGVFCL